MRYSGYYTVIIDNRIYWHTGPVSRRQYLIDVVQRNAREKASKGEKKVLMKKIIWFFQGFLKAWMASFALSQWLKSWYDLKGISNVSQIQPVTLIQPVIIRMHVFPEKWIWTWLMKCNSFKRQHAKLTRYFGFVLSVSQKS